jgi:hypothetical protein
LWKLEAGNMEYRRASYAPEIERTLGVDDHARKVIDIC